MYFISTIHKQIISIKTFIFKYLFQFLPKNKKWVTFDNFNGRGYGENPKYICNKIHQKFPHFKLFWLVNSKNEYSLPDFVEPVYLYSIKAIYILSKSRIIINNVKNLLPFFKRSSQYYIQTWHGCLALKYIEQEVEVSLNPDYVEESKKETGITDLILAGGEADYMLYKNSFWGEKNIFKCGSPRNDVFFEDNTDKILNLKEKLGIDNKSKILMYAPTFRDDNSLNGYDINLSAVLTTLETKTNDKWVILVRMHPNVSDVDNLFPMSNQIINVSKYPDPQDLSIVADALITDYSSICLDFMLQNKPVTLYISDYDDYKKHSRPLRSLFDKLPFQKASSNELLIKNINAFDYQNYLDDVKYFMNNLYKSYDNGSATEQVVNRILYVINNDIKSINVS